MRSPSVNHDGAHSKVGAKPLPPREIYHLKTEITHINIDCRRSIFAMTDVKKESILSKYKDPNMELEIRLKGESGELNKEVFESVYNSLNASPDFAGPEITYTLNFIVFTSFELPIVGFKAGFLKVLRIYVFCLSFQ